MNFFGQAKPLHDGDVQTIAGYLGVHIATVRAVLAVESAGRGFDRMGRPKMLFEPHVFYRQLGAGTKRNRAEREGLAYAKWKPGSYPADSYPRLVAAIDIDQTAALKSASWGLGQVMGFNYKISGFTSVEEFVRAMTYSEGAHLYAMARFIVYNNLQKHLRSRYWAGFANGYNGSGYATHRYHIKLAEAYEGRPLAEKRVPPPASESELNALLGLGIPPIPVPRPEPEVEGNWLVRLIRAIIEALFGPRTPRDPSEPPDPEDRIIHR